MKRFAVLLLTLLITVSLLTPTVFAKENGGSRPGWGYGDTNHVHTGPSGQSVRPHPDNDGDSDDVLSPTSVPVHTKPHHNVISMNLFSRAWSHFFSLFLRSHNNFFHI